MYHYTECGLDNVWLENGYTVKKTPYGKGVAVVGADQLHQLLALSLTEKPGKLTGKEFRFLRTMMCLSQENLAKMVGVTAQALSLWERHGRVPKSGDAIVRMLVKENMNGDGHMRAVLDRINTVERLVNQRIVAREQAHRWTAQSESAAPTRALEPA